MDVEELCHGLCFLHAVDDFHEWFHAVSITSLLVDGEFIEVAEFPFHASLFIVHVFEVVENGVDTFVVVFSQLVETAIARVSRRQWVVFHPSAASKLIEVVGRTSCLVEIVYRNAC